MTSFYTLKMRNKNFPNLKPNAAALSSSVVRIQNRAERISLFASKKLPLSVCCLFPF